MRPEYDETLHLRLPRELRSDLDRTARAAGVKLSVATRNALVVGLAALRPTPDDPPPPPTAPAGASMPAAA